MKLLESKFYTPKHQLVASQEPPYDIFISDLKDEAKNRSNPYEVVLDRLLASIYLNGDDMVITKDKLIDMTQCDDFHIIAFDAKKNRCYERESCYYHPTLEVFLLTSEDLSNDYDEVIVEAGLLKVSAVYYDSTNPNAPANLRTLFADVLEKYSSEQAKVSILLKEHGSLVLKTHKITPYPMELDLMYADDFLPVHERIQHSLTHDSKGVVLLHGVAGSGKTNYIKWLTSQVPDKKFIFVPTNMIAMLTDPSFMGLLLEHRNAVLVLEDCENYIAERTADNSNTDVVSSILNIADGMLSDILECQFVCTFNSDISKIDSALLRKGRLIAEYKFKELSVEKSNAYLASINKNITVDNPHTLAELTNIDVASFKEKVVTKKIGFF